MADKLVNCERELKLGASFSNNKATQYHTIKYDFKPASVDVNKMATVDVGTSNQVTVTVPHLDGAGVPQTVFKGNQRPYTKECVLIIDRNTGEITLEKLSSNIQVKKTRQESASKPRPLTPVELTNTTQRSSSRTRVTSGASRRINPAGGAVIGGGGGARYPGAPHKTPPQLVRSPPRVKTSPPQAAPWSAGGHSTLASLPMIGLDEAPMHNGYAPPGPAPAPPPARPSLPERNSIMTERSTSERNSMPERNSLAERNSLPERISMTERNPMLERNSMSERNPMVERNSLPDRNSMPERSVMPERIIPRPQLNNQHISQPTVPEQSSSSSSSDSSGDSDSGSDSDDDAKQTSANVPLTNGSANSSSQPPLLSDVLNDDLCLSESGSDSD